MWDGLQVLLREKNSRFFSAVFPCVDLQIFRRPETPIAVFEIARKRILVLDLATDQDFHARGLIPI
jgi:hypothetical protein